MIIVGNLTIDEIVTKEKTYRNVLGGPPAYAIEALYSVFNEKPYVYSCVGYDFPRAFENELAPLSNLHIFKSSSLTTRFRLVEVNGRELFMISYSGKIETIDFSSESVYMFSPVYREVPNVFIEKAYSVGFVTLDPQGYLRTVDSSSRVYLRFSDNVWKLMRYVNVLRVSTDEYLALSKGLNVKKFLEKAYSLGVEVAIVTSPKTVYVISGEGYLEYPTFKNVNVKSTTGAGDVFTAFFTYIYSKSYDLEKALAYAIVASSFTVEKIGPTRISKAEFFRRLEEYVDEL